MYDIIIYGIIIIIVVRFFYIHTKYPFWSHMPVHHVYDLIAKDGAYIQSFPLRHKYTTPLLIKTIPFLEVNDTYLKYFVELLQIGYTNDDNILCTMQQKNLRAYMTGYNNPAFVSFYCDPIYKPIEMHGRESKIPLPAVQVDLEPEPAGCIASYPVSMNKQYELNFITYKSGKNVLELIATHDYNTRRLNPNIKACLYKSSNATLTIKGGAQSGVIPLVQYTSKHYVIPRYLYKVKEIVQIYRQNWAFALDILEEVHRIYDLVIKIDIGAIRSRIEAEEWFVYAFVQRDETMALYFIENAHTLYENENIKTLRLVASVNNGLSMEKFNAGFQDCLRRIVKMNLDYKRVWIECIGDNGSIILGEPIERIEYEYYLINLVNKTKVDVNKAIMVI